MSTPKIEIYTSPFCGFCSHAKSLLDSKMAAYEEFCVMMKPTLRDEMMKRSGGGHTVPQIFIGGEHIGGCDELVALDRKGGLDVMLQCA